jgi:hypothetical protein
MTPLRDSGSIVKFIVVHMDVPRFMRRHITHLSDIPAASADNCSSAKSLDRVLLYGNEVFGHLHHQKPNGPIVADYSRDAGDPTKV